MILLCLEFVESQWVTIIWNEEIHVGDFQASGHNAGTCFVNFGTNVERVPVQEISCSLCSSIIYINLIWTKLIRNRQLLSRLTISYFEIFHARHDGCFANDLWKILFRVAGDKFEHTWIRTHKFSPLKIAHRSSIVQLNFHNNLQRISCVSLTLSYSGYQQNFLIHILEKTITFPSRVHLRMLCT